MMLFIINVHRTVKLINKLGFLFFAACTFKVGDLGFAVIDYLPSGIILKDEEESSALVIVEVEYVEPETETEEEDGDDEGSKPSDSEVTKPSKPSDSEVTKPSKPSDGETAKPSKPSEGETTNPSVPSEGTGNDSSTDGVTGEQNNQNNEAGSGTSDKTESNS